MRMWILTAGLGGVMLVAAALHAGDDKAETPDDSTPSIIVTCCGKSGHADSEKAMKSVVTPLREAFADKNVLFLNIDVSSRETRNQAKLLLNSLELSSIWKKLGTKPGSVAIYDVMEGEIVLMADATTAADKAKKAISDVLARGAGDDEPEAEDEPEPEDEESMD